MDQLGKALVISGLSLASIGMVVWVASMTGFRLGRLPGDIVIQKPTYSVYIPITSMIALSVALSIAAAIVGTIRR